MIATRQFPTSLDTVDPAHASRQIGLGCLDQQVIVVVHEAVSVAEPVEAADDKAGKVEKGAPVSVVAEDAMAGIPPGSNMVKSAWILRAEWTSHERSIPRVGGRTL